jgi:hypothetical protein
VAEITNNNDDDDDDNNNNNNNNNGIIIIIIIKMASFLWAAELLYFAHKNLHLDFNMGKWNLFHPISFC